MIKLIIFNFDNTYPDFMNIIIELYARKYTLYAVGNIPVKELNRKINDIQCCDYFQKYEHNNLYTTRDYYIEIIKKSNDKDIQTKQILIIDNNYFNVKTANNLGLSICLYYKSIQEILNVITYHNDENKPKSSIFTKRLNIVIPIMGDNTRFQNSRVKTERSLIQMMNKMVPFWTISNLQIDANYIFIVREHLCRINKYDQILQSMFPNCQVIQSIKKTEGNACSILLAEQYINNDDPLVVVDDNQWLSWDIERLLVDFLLKETALLQMITFNPYGNNNYHYISTDEQNNKIVKSIHLNKPISEYALTDVYFWRHGKDFIKYTHRMISRNQRYLGEFCTSLIANELFDDILDKKIQDDSVIHVSCPKFFKFNNPSTLDEFRIWYENRLQNQINEN